MKTAELLLQDFDSIMSNTRRTLERIPDDKRDYKPHEKSMPMGRLAMHCATLPQFGSVLLEEDGMDMATSKRDPANFIFESGADCLRKFDANAAKCRALLAGVSEEALAAPWRFSAGDRTISNVSRAQTVQSMFLNHLIHHVAQLGVYLRLNDLPVPSLFGPSADEQWGAK